MKRIKILDSLRGLAAFVVVFHHVYTRLPHLFISFHSYLNKVFNIVSELNVEAVIFFFILSGFSIRLSLRNDIVMKKENINEYLYRRFKRILPLYFITLIITFLVGFIINQTHITDFSIKNLIGNIFFLQISKSYEGYWFAPYGNNGPLWSLPFEMFYYLFFPLFFIFLNKVFSGRIFGNKFIEIGLIISLLISLVSTVLNKYFFFPYIAYSTLFYSWYVGFFIAHIYMKKEIKLDINFFIVIIIGILLLVLYKFTLAATLMKLFLGGATAILIYITLLLTKTPLKKVLSIIESIFNFLFYKVGKGSYALYLLHYPILLLIMHYKEKINLFFVCLIFMILAIMCRYIEEELVKRKFLFFKIKYF